MKALSSRATLRLESLPSLSLCPLLWPPKHTQSAAAEGFVRTKGKLTGSEISELETVHHCRLNGRRINSTWMIQPKSFMCF